MDRIDIAILEALQRDSRLTITNIGDEVGLSSSACHRRVQSLQESGIINSYSARLNPVKLGLGVQAFIEITLKDQSRESMDRFEALVVDMDDILECYLMSGEADYMLSVAAINLNDFDEIHRNCLSELPGVSSMTTKFLIRRIKDWNGYPVKRLRGNSL